MVLLSGHLEADERKKFRCKNLANSRALVICQKAFYMENFQLALIKLIFCAGKTLHKNEESVNKVAGSTIRKKGLVMG